MVATLMRRPEEDDAISTHNISYGSNSNHNSGGISRKVLHCVISRGGLGNDQSLEAILAKCHCQ